MRKFDQEERQMNDLIEQVKEQVQEAWDQGHRVTITVESRPKKKKAAVEVAEREDQGLAPA